MMKLIMPTLSMLTCSRTSFAFVSVLSHRHHPFRVVPQTTSSEISLSPDAYFDDPRGSSMLGDQTEPAWTTEPGYSYSEGGMPNMRRNYAGDDGPLARRRSEQELAPNNYDYDIYADPQQTSIQGGSRRTWQQRGGQWTTMGQDSGRPMFAEYEIWDGPNNTPQSVNLYSEDGSVRPARINNRAKRGGTMQIRNTGPMTYPMTAGVSWQHPPRQQYEETYAAPTDMMSYGGTTVQGGALKTFQFDDESIRNVHIILTTMGTPLKALIELWQGPNNVKQIAEVYSDDGMNKPFEMVFDTPGYGTTIAVRNVGPVEYPLKAIAEPVGFAEY